MLQDICPKCKRKKENYPGCYLKCPVGLMLTDMDRKRRREEMEIREKKREEDIVDNYVKKRCSIEKKKAHRRRKNR